MRAGLVVFFSIFVIAFCSDARHRVKKHHDDLTKKQSDEESSSDSHEDKGSNSSEDSQADRDGTSKAVASSSKISMVSTFDDAAESNGTSEDTVVVHSLSSSANGTAEQLTIQNDTLSIDVNADGSSVVEKRSDNSTENPSSEDLLVVDVINATDSDTENSTILLLEDEDQNVKLNSTEISSDHAAEMLEINDNNFASNNTVTPTPAPFDAY